MKKRILATLFTLAFTFSFTGIAAAKFDPNGERFVHMVEETLPGCCILHTAIGYVLGIFG